MYRTEVAQRKNMKIYAEHMGRVYNVKNQPSRIDLPIS